MTDIEQKALALVNEVAKEMGLVQLRILDTDLPGERALCRAIEQHEAFRQEVSDAVGSYIHDPQSITGPATMQHLRRFIIPKPDPLVEALEEASGTNDPVEWANRFYAAIEKRGGKIVWGEG